MNPNISSNLTNITDLNITDIILLNRSHSDQNLTLCDEYNNELSIRQLSEPTAIVLVFVYAITSLLAILGNIVVIIVQVFGKRSSKSNLRKFLTILAISDIFIGIISLPLELIFRRWVLPLWLCPIHRFVFHLSVCVTSYTLAIIAIERYYAVLYPLSKNRWTSTQCNLIILLEWVVSVLTSIYAIIYFKPVPFKSNGKTYYYCGGNRNEMVTQIFHSSTFFMTFALPLVVLIYCYVKIGRTLTRINSENNLGKVQYNRENQNINRMLAVVVIAFIICWFPIRIIVVFGSFQTKLYTNPRKYLSSLNLTVKILIFFFRWLSVANSFVNPIIYSFMCNNFQGDFKELCSKLTQKIVKFKTFILKIVGMK